MSDFTFPSPSPSPDVGPIIQQVRELVDDHFIPKAVECVDPVTGATALALITKDGARPVPATMFSDYLKAPRRRQGTATLTDLDSFIAHVKRFMDSESALFAIDDRSAPSIEAVLNYHHAGPAANAATRFGDHRSRHAFPLSDEWTAWTEADKKVFPMGEFAAFLEDRIIDVIVPDVGETLPDDLARFIAICGGNIATPTKLVELSRGLKVNENAVVREAINLSSGEGQIAFKVEHTGDNGERLNVPGLFLIGIPVFKGGVPYRLAARLRYRKTGEGLKFFFELWRADRVFDHAFREACHRAQSETGLPLLFGKPE